MPPNPAGHDASALQARVGPVLAGLAFPARRWQVLAEADLYGCDGVTRSLLVRLPELTYPSFGDLLAVLSAVMHGRRVPSGPPARPLAVPPRAQRSGTEGGAAGRPGSLAPGRRGAARTPRTPGSPSPAA